MKRSEKFYGAAIGVVLAVAVFADSPNFELWTVIAVIGILTATGLVYAGRNAESRELHGGVYKKWEGGRNEEMKK